ncbi:hypothetical protein SeMB42_g05169, partial [Synchytrium endobioticum]
MSLSQNGHNYMVYPANGSLGYEICRELVEGEFKKGSIEIQKKKRVHKVIAVCCSRDAKWVDKLKNLGGVVHVINLDNATRVESWRKALKHCNVDCMMLCTEPPNVKRRDTNGHAHEMSPEQFATSMEVAVEMTSHLYCSCLCVSTAYCADDAKYKTWYRLYSAIDKAADRHFRGYRSVIYHNLMFEALFLNRDEILKDKKLSWPVSPSSEATPVALHDYSRCCVAVMSHMLKHETTALAHRRADYRVTGAARMSPQEMIDMMSSSFDKSIEYKQVQRKEWRKSAADSLSPLQIRCLEEIFDMMEDGNLHNRTKEVKHLTHKTPMSFQSWLKDHEKDFQGQ